MTRKLSYFGFESIVTAALAMLVVTTLSMFAHAVLNPMVVV